MTSEPYSEMDLLLPANPSVIYKTVKSPLSLQTRVLTCFKDASGYAVASIEGRVGVQFIDESRGKDNYSFKVRSLSNRSSLDKLS